MPVPHFGAALTVEEFKRVAAKLENANWQFILKPHQRFLAARHQQWVLFVLDPAGNAIELKAFTEIEEGEWV